MKIGEEEFNIPTPVEIKKELDKRIIGQDDAKITLSVAVYNHYKRMIIKEREGVDIEKSNIIISGPTGCGKTSIIRAIADLINVPCYVADATTLTQAGYVGDDVESILVGLIRAANYNVKVAEYGIIFIDEIDKIAKKSASQNITRDVVGEGVQQGLLKIVEGGIVGVPPNGGRKHPDQELLYIDTRNILFIVGGAFVGLDSIIKDRMGLGETRSKIDFCQVDTENIEFENYYDLAVSEDYRKYGFIPEFVGRFPIYTYVNKLTKSDLKKILTKTENSILTQYKKLMNVDGIDLEFTRGAIDEIVNYAYIQETGARGLRNVVDRVMKNFMFISPGSEITGIKIMKNDIKDAMSISKVVI